MEQWWDDSQMYTSNMKVASETTKSTMVANVSSPIQSEQAASLQPPPGIFSQARSRQSPATPHCPAVEHSPAKTITPEQRARALANMQQGYY